MSEGKYNIKAVSALTGIQPGTLRAWERRYEILEPVRNQAGHRLYTEEQIRKLKWLSKKVQQGMTISQAATLLGQQKDVLNAFPDQLLNQRDALSEKLLQALLQFNEAKAQEIMNQAFAFFTTDFVSLHILGDLLFKLEEMWERGTVSAAQKHFSSSAVKTKINMVMQSFRPNRMLPKVVAVCGPGEPHDFDLLRFAFISRQLGHEVVCIGQEVEEDDLVSVIETVNPQFLFFSCAMNENKKLSLKLAKKFEKAFPDLKVRIGGAAMTDHFSGEESRFSVGDNQEKWETWLSSCL